MSSPPKMQDRRTVLTACAVALATAVGSTAAGSVPEARAIEKLEHYCMASWRNAGIRPEDWEDCTQQALVELLEQVSREGLPTAIANSNSKERRELNRTMWRLVQRSRRAVRQESFDEQRMFVKPKPQQGEGSEQPDWSNVEAIGPELLSARQLRILEMTRDGWRVGEIAEQLKLSPARVSDEKYKALARLRERFGNRS